MNKYFKNEKKLTVESILKMYENYDWGDYPELTSKKAEAEKLMRECDESDQYKNWMGQCAKIRKQRQQVQSELKQIEACKTEILLRNSIEQYQKIHKQLSRKYGDLDYELSNLTKNAPKSKWDKFEVIKKSISRGEQLARAQQDRWLQQQKQRCHCSGHYCQC